MADEKKMSFLLIGDKKFEIADEQAREKFEDIDDLKTTVNEIINHTKWVKSWENPNPNAGFAEQQIEFDNDEEIVIEYKENKSDGETKFMHFKRSSSRHEGSIGYAAAGTNGVFAVSRDFYQGQMASVLIFDDAYKANGSTAATVDNNYIIPIAIYTVETLIED